MRVVHVSGLCDRGMGRLEARGWLRKARRREHIDEAMWQVRKAVSGQVVDPVERTQADDDQC